MRNQSLTLALAMSAALGAAGLAQAQTAPAAAPATAPAGGFTDAELAQFGKAMAQIRALNVSGTPTAEQATAMQKAVSDNGLTAERFNAISTAASKDAVVRARVDVASAPASPAGSVAAGVTDAELDQYAKAMKAIRALNVTGAPTADQATAMRAAVTDNGLTAERFNAIATAIPQDARLRARAELASAKLG